MNEERWPTAGEEIANSLSHGAGLVFAIAGTPFLVIAAMRYGSAWNTIGVSVFAASMISLYLASTLYHALTHDRAKRFFRLMDHSAIFILIAGTYTPFALLALNGALATAILIVVWIGAIAGAVVESIWIDHPKWVAALIYLSLGWVAIAAFPALWSSIGVGGSLLIAAGGLLYTAGAVVYATQRPNPNPAIFGYHEVFHLFVIAAAIAHFSAIAFFALPHH